MEEYIKDCVRDWRMSERLKQEVMTVAIYGELFLGLRNRGAAEVVLPDGRLMRKCGEKWVEVGALVE